MAENIASKQNLNIEHIDHIENLILQDSFLDAAKILTHIEDLMTELASYSIPLLNRLSDVNDKMMQFARNNTKENINKVNDINSKILHLQRSIESMKPVVEKKKEIEKILNKNAGKMLYREFQYGLLKSLPVICSFFLTVFIETYTPFFEKLIHDKSAHVIVLLVSFLLETYGFHKLLEKWKENIIKKQLKKDITRLKQCYIDIETVVLEFNAQVENNPMPEIFT